MPYRGRWQLGEHVPMQVQCRNSTGAPVAPTAAPTLSVYDSSGTRIVNEKTIPVLDRFGTTGLFGIWLYLTSAFAAGQYAAVYSWTSGVFTGRFVEQFEVVAGGNADGAVISMYYYQRPHARFVVQQLDSGRLVKNRNPSL